MLVAFSVILAIYIIASLCYAGRFVFNSPKLTALGLRIVMIGIIVQIAVLTTHFIMGPRPLVLNYLEYFQFSALFLALTFVVLCFTKKFYNSGPFFILFIDVFCGLSLIFKERTVYLAGAEGSGYLFIHLVFIFLALSIFSLAFVTAVMFLLSERQLKAKKFRGTIRKFPSLDVLDKTHYKALYAGFILLTFVIITGAGYSKMINGHYLTGDSKQILSFMSWILFALLLNFRVRKGLQGHRGIVLSLAGFACVFTLFLVGLI